MIKRCITLIFNFTVDLLSICSIFFEVFTRPLLLGRRYFFSCIPLLVNFWHFIFYRIFKQLRSTFPSFGSSPRSNFSCLGVSYLHLLFRMPKAQSRRPIHVKMTPVQSLAGSPDTKCLLQSRSFSKIESVSLSLLIAKIHLLLNSAVNSACVHEKSLLFRRWAVSFALYCHIRL